MLPAAPDPPLREALLLLPELPATALVVGDTRLWEPALSAWGVQSSGAPSALAVGDDARSLVATRAQQLLLRGADRHGHLAAAGYRVVTWWSASTCLGAPALVADGAPALARLLRNGGGRRRPRQVAADAARRLQGLPCVTVAVRAPAAPMVLSSLAAPEFAVLLGQASARRRPVFLVSDRPGELTRVVKVGHGDDAAERVRAEQDVLLLLARLGIPGVPCGLGAGTVRGISWSVESGVMGAPLLAVLRRLPAGRALHALELAADRLTDLAVRSRGARAGDSGLRLRGDHVAVASMLPQGLPGVLVHGDAAANVQLSKDARSISLLDWETARQGGLPLHDLVPVLCLGLAAARRVRDGDTATYLLAVLRGQSADSAWLLGQVRRHLTALEVPVRAAGPLVGAALASWASLRLAHDELVRAAGLEPTAWLSPADELAAAWRSDAALGPAWPVMAA